MKVYTAKEIADIMQMNVQTVLKYLRENKIEHIKIGTNYRVTQEQLDKFMKSK